MLETLIEELKKHDTKEVCYKSGISQATLLNIISGRNTNPTIKVVQALQDFVEAKNNELSK